MPIRVGLERVSRRPPWPTWAVALVVLWLLLVLGAEWVGSRRGKPLPLCWFRAVTSLRCPACGTTRMVKTFLAGRPLDAFYCNPLIAVIALFLAAGLLLQVLFGRRVTVRIVRGKRNTSLS